MASQTTASAKAIIQGYPWEITFQAQDNDPRFQTGTTFRAQFRAREESPVLASISTGSGITHETQTRIKISLTGAQTGNMTPGTVTFDLVRTDLPNEEYTYIKAVIPVKRAITREAG